MKNSLIARHLPLLAIVSLIASSCSKKNNVIPTTTDGINGFWHGGIGKSPNQVGVAFLIRSNGTVTEYDNDFFTSGTTMTATDTASAKFKINGIYSISPGDSGSINITITYNYSEPNLQHNYTNVGIISGTTMTGTWTDNYVSAGINTTNTFFTY